MLIPQKKKAAGYYLKAFGLNPAGDYCGDAGWRLFWLAYRNGNAKLVEYWHKRLLQKGSCLSEEKRERIDLKNQSETLVYQTEKQLAELGDKIDSATKEKVEEKSKALKEATDKDDYDAMKKLLEELQQELYAVGSSVYQQPGNQSNATGPSDQAPPKDGEDDVIDADFTESK